jgi:signal transduction histidine kinase
MLKFITENRDVIEKGSRERFLARLVPKPTEQELNHGIPMLIDQLLETLRRGEELVPESEIEAVATAYGGRLFSLGFTVSEIVHAYGAMCETVMGLARELGVHFAPSELEVLNRILDVAIAAAVTEHQRRRGEEIAQKDLEHLGVLAHELRNALSAAKMAFDVIKKGAVSIGGRTAGVLDCSLTRMTDLIDRALAEIRLQTDSKPLVERLRLADVLDQVATVMQREADIKNQTLDVEVEHKLEIEADRQLLTSAISNLVQNALKYTHAGGRISVRGREMNDRIVIEVEDHCGGLPPGNPEDLFKPFVRRTTQRMGVGLGLSIVMRAANALGGDVQVRDLPGKGCIFRIELPRVLSADHNAPCP